MSNFPITAAEIEDHKRLVKADGSRYDVDAFVDELRQMYDSRPSTRDDVDWVATLFLWCDSRSQDKDAHGRSVSDRRELVQMIK